MQSSETFHALVDEHADYLYRLSLLIMKDKELAYDLVHDTFLSAHQSLAQFEGRSSTKTWLIKILKNKIIDHYRKQKIQLDINENADSDDFFNESGTWKKDLVAFEKADASLNKKEISRFIKDCIQRLNESLRMIFVLKYLEENSSENICKEMNISTSNFWTMSHRARLQVRECLEKKGMSV